MHDHLDPYEPEHEDERIFGRLIDGEAAPRERAQFEARADAEPSLWRQLALRQLDRQELVRAVAETTADAAAVELPSRPRFAPRITWSMALSGWAAVLIVALSWGLVTLGERNAPRPERGREAAAVPYDLTPEEHFQRYLEAPYVLGDMQPVVLDVQQLDDGRIVVNFIRRVEEVLFLDPGTPLPVDENGELIRDTGSLRKEGPARGMPN